MMGGARNRLLARLLTRFPWLLERLTRNVPAYRVEGVPWTPLARPLAESTVALVTTAGVHLASQEPFDMKDPMGDPSFRELPSDTPSGLYAITHDYYDHTDADSDLNVVFPLDRLRELAGQGLIGSVAPTNYGFMGHIDGPHMDTLVKRTAPEVAERLRAEGVHAALLTPG